MNKIQIFTDGSSLGNPGPGGFAAIMRFNGREKIVKGGEPVTTNNRMEMRALIEAFKKIKDKTVPVEVYSDSTLLVSTMTKGWKRKKNQDLWADLDKLAEGLKIEGEGGGGHAGHPENTRADRIAVAEATKQQINYQH